MLDPAFGLVIDSAGTLLFASAAAHKLRRFDRFRSAFAGYGLLARAPARALAWLVPAAELAVATGLALDPARRAATAAAIGMLGSYAFAIAINLRRGRRDLDCGCGPLAGRHAGAIRAIAPWMIWRNLGLAGGLALAALPWSGRPLGAADRWTVAAALIAGGVLYLALERLLGDVAPRARALAGNA